MNQFTRLKPQFVGHRSRQREGVVLLIALGMLGLFSILTVTYVVFSSQARNASTSFVTRINDGERPKDLFPQVMQQIIVGSNNPRSAANGQGLLEDLYGYDSVRLRVAHYRTDRANATPVPPPAPPIEAFGELFGTLPGTYQPGDAPRSTLFRFPLRFARWNFDGSTAAGSSTALQVPELSQSYQGIPLAGDNPVTAAVEPNDLNTREQFDDAYTGRIVTFLEGPLGGHSFHVVRSFGQDTNATYQNGTPESVLSHNLVIDLSEFPSQTIEVGGVAFDRWIIADSSPTALLYGAGPDGRPGIANVDDNGAGGVDDLSEYGTANSDDMGYRLVINGQVFNGAGADAAFAAGTSTAVRPGWNAYAGAGQPPGWSDPGMTSLLQPNNRYLGATVGAQPDEAFDAPDLENMFLAWQPSVRSAGISIHGAAQADLLINQAIIPSFHRPALFNYLMNQPLDFAGSTTPARTFAQLNMTNGEDVIRAKILVRRLRRACLRPLPFVGDSEDLDGDGEFIDGSPGFTGSNPTPILRVQLNPQPATAVDLVQIRLLARWLVNGPWDVDNDHDGIPESIWTDFELPSFTAPDGTILRPLVAALIEDLDGKVNINTAGNHAQMATNFFGLDFSSAPATTTPTTFRLTARGFGVGPSEVFPGFLFGRRVNTPTTAVPAALTTLFGRVLQSRYGGRQLQLGAPGYDDGAWADDLVSQMIHPARRDVHAANAPMGMPMDAFGRGAVDLDEQGNVVVQNLTTPVAAAPLRTERTNDPYEMATEGPPLGNDQPFTTEEFLAVIDRNNPNRTAFQSRLLELLDQSLQANPELSRLITTESRGQRIPEMSGYGGTTGGTLSALGSMMDLYVAHLENFMGPSNNAVNINNIERSLTKMLAVEFRKGSKLNLNRPIGNGIDDSAPANGVVDDTAETVAEAAYPQLPMPDGSTFARYVPYDPVPISDFTDLSGQELLARNLYVLMFMLVRDPKADATAPAEIVPNFPYPQYRLANGTLTPFVADINVRNRYVARRLAQWAVNAVDFRDTNCAMTRFRFDEDPFDANGWDTSGGFETVWGAEPSDLILTEASAMHDRGTRDTSLDLGEFDVPMPTAEDTSRTVNNPGDTPDADMDQLRIPTASAFIEVMNTRPISTGGAYLHYPPELYDFSTAPPRLDLARVVGVGGNRSPVWRVAVGQGVSPGDADRTLKSPRWLADGERLSNNASDPFMGVPFNRFAEEHVHLATFESGGSGLLAFGPDQRQIAIDRVVWFTDLDPTAVVLPTDAPNPQQVFRNVFASSPTSPPRIAPGQYALIAPRLLTEFGQKNTCVEGNLFEYDPSEQKIQLVLDGGTNQWEAHYVDLGGADLTPPYQSDNANYRLREIIPIIAQAIPPHIIQPGPLTAGWNNYFTNVAPNSAERVDFGFNISAPLTDANYYPAPGYKLNSTAGTDFPHFDSYYDAVTPAGAPRDQPVDEIAASGKPLQQNGWLAGGTYQDASTAFLQRLADPSQPYNAATNPYITVDWMTLDLTVFSGQQDLDDTVDSNGDGMFNESVDQNAMPGDYVAKMQFDTRRKIPDTRRDRAGTINGTKYVHRSMYMNRLNILNGQPAAGANTFFDFDLRNNPVLPPAATLNTGIGDNPDVQLFPATLGFVSREYGPPRLVGTPNYVGMPEKTYMAALPWYDRDYASAYEITMVPACSSAGWVLNLIWGPKSTSPRSIRSKTKWWPHSDICSGSISDTTRQPIRRMCWEPVPGSNRSLTSSIPDRSTPMTNAGSAQCRRRPPGTRSSTASPRPCGLRSITSRCIGCPVA